MLRDGDVEEQSNSELGLMVSMVLLTDVFRTITHSSILLDAVSLLLNKESWPRLRQMLHSADDRLTLCFLCLIDAILDSGYGTNMMYAFESSSTTTNDNTSSMYPNVCEKMKLVFSNVIMNKERKSVLLNSMIEVLVVSPSRPLLTMLSTSVLILRMLRSSTRLDKKKRKLHELLSPENVRQIKDGHATTAVRILAIVRREKAEHESYISDLEKKRKVRKRYCHMLLVLEEQYGAMAEPPPSLRLILNRVDALLPVPPSPSASSVSFFTNTKISDETLDEMTRARQTVQKWLVLRWLMRELNMSNEDVDPLTSVIGCKSQVKVGTRIEIKKLTPYTECHVRVGHNKAIQKMWLIVGRRWVLLVQPEKPKKNSSSSKRKEKRLLGVARAIVRVHHCEVTLGSSNGGSNGMLNLYCRSRNSVGCAIRVKRKKKEEKKNDDYDDDHHPLQRSRVGGLGPLTLWHIPLILSSNEACVLIKHKIEKHAGSLQLKILDSIEKILVDSVR